MSIAVVSRTVSRSGSHAQACLGMRKPVQRPVLVLPLSETGARREVPMQEVPRSSFKDGSFGDGREKDLLQIGDEASQRRSFTSSIRGERRDKHGFIKDPGIARIVPISKNHDSFDQDEFPLYEPPSELPNNHISEMESTSVMPEMDSAWNVNPQQLQKQPQPDEKSPTFSEEAYSSMAIDPAHHVFSEVNPPWSPSSFETPNLAQRPSGRHVPALALNTRDIYQPPSSRHRHGRTGTLADEPMSATIISPLSATEGFFSSVGGMSGNKYEISPTDSQATSNSFFTNDSGYASATIDHAWSATTVSMDYDCLWDSHDVMMKKSDLDVYSGVTLGRDVGLMKPPSNPSSAASSNLPSRSSSNSSNHSANRCTSIVKRKELSPHWTDPKSLAVSFVEVLNEHLRHSRNALNQLPSNSTINELLAMSSASIISIGFNVLRGLLEKRNPTAIIEIFAFSHVAYAAAIAVDDKSSKIRTKRWFQDSLCWLSGLTSDRQRMTYTLIVQAIWKPQDLTGMGDCLDFSKLAALAQNSPHDENTLVKACRHFLDSKCTAPAVFYQTLTRNCSSRESLQQ